MFLDDYKEQVEDIERTIMLAIENREPRVSNVKAPFEPKDGFNMNFRFCETYIHASGALGFKPTKRTYLKKCPCCKTMIDGSN